MQIWTFATPRAAGAIVRERKLFGLTTEYSRAA